MGKFKRQVNVRQEVPKEPEKPYITVKRVNFIQREIHLYGFGRHGYLVHLDSWYAWGGERAQRKAKRKLATYLRKHSYTVEPEVRFTGKNIV